MNQIINIGNYAIGASSPCFIIAEAGVNHNGNINMAMQLVDVAKKAGADAVKFQTFTPENLVCKTTKKAEYQIQNGKEETQLEMLKKLCLTAEDYKKLLDYCLQQNILFLSSPFSEENALFLNELDVVAFKIPSGEITNIRLFKTIATFGKPVILSTGMSTLQEVTDAVKILQINGCENLALLHCVTSYPAEPEDTNLNAIKTLAEEFKVPVGFSDHSLGIEIPLAAVAMGACIIEKHFTLDKTLSGPDHKASLDSFELETMVKGIRKIEKAFGDGKKEPTLAEMKIAKIARKSLVSAEYIPKGTLIGDGMIKCKRPGTGLGPQDKNKVLGKVALENISADTVFEEGMLN